MPIFMNSEGDLIISGYYGGLEDVAVAALLLGTFFGEIQEAEARKQP